MDREARRETPARAKPKAPPAAGQAAPRRRLHLTSIAAEYVPVRIACGGIGRCRGEWGRRTSPDAVQELRRDERLAHRPVAQGGKVGRRLTDGNGPEKGRQVRTQAQTHARPIASPWRFVDAGPRARGTTVMGPASENLHKPASRCFIRSPRRCGQAALAARSGRAPSLPRAIQLPSGTANLALIVPRVVARSAGPARGRRGFEFFPPARPVV